MCSLLVGFDQTYHSTASNLVILNFKRRTRCQLFWAKQQYLHRLWTLRSPSRWQHFLNKNQKYVRTIRTMMLFETRMLLVSLCLIAFTVNYAALSEESCYRFRGKANVTIDTDQCLWENYTEPKMKRVCLERCLQNASVRSWTFLCNRSDCNNKL